MAVSYSLFLIFYLLPPPPINSPFPSPSPWSRASPVSPPSCPPLKPVTLNLKLEIFAFSLFMAVCQFITNFTALFE